MNNKKGFLSVEVLVIVAVLIVLGLVGWAFYNKTSEDSASNSDSATTSMAVDIPQIASKNDIQGVVDAVNAIDVDKSVDTSDIVTALE